MHSSGVGHGPSIICELYTIEKNDSMTFYSQGTGYFKLFPSYDVDVEPLSTTGSNTISETI